MKIYQTKTVTKKKFFQLQSRITLTLINLGILGLALAIGLGLLGLALALGL